MADLDPAGQTANRLQTLDSSIFGNVVRYSQRQVERKPIKEEQIRLRPLLGLYRKFCRADIEEQQRVLDMVKTDSISHIDLNLAFAEF